MRSIVVGVDGTIYAGTSGMMIAIDPDGNRKWEASSGFAVVGRAGRVYLSTVNSESEDNEAVLHALAPDGTLIWEFSTGAAAFSAPTIGPDGALVVASSDSVLHSLDSDGTERWSYKGISRFADHPAIGLDGSIYTTTRDGNLNAYSHEGELKWRFSAKANQAPVVGPDGTVYADQTGSSFWAISPDGTEKWSEPITGVRPSVDRQGIIYLPKGDGFAALYPDGSFKWKRQNPSDGIGLAIGQDGTLYHEVDSAHGNAGPSYIQAVHRRGNLLWQHKIGPSIRAGPVIGTNNRLYVGTEKGLYAIGEADATPTYLEAELPTSYELLPNHPNPFNPTTQITYSLPEPGRVRLTVFDGLGRAVEVLTQGWKPSGTHEVRFDGRGLPSGIYWYRLRAGDFQEARAMILIE